MTKFHPGGCLCGAVRFTIDANPSARGCAGAAIASGSATVNVLFPEEAVSIIGDLGLFTMIADSGNTVERGFCKHCGSQFYSRTVSSKGLPMRIRACVLDDPELKAPTAAIWTESAPSWAPIPEGMPRHPKGPPPV